MKLLTRTIIVLAVINLITENFAPAQEPPEQRIPAKRMAPATPSGAPVHAAPKSVQPGATLPTPVPEPQPMVPKPEMLSVPEEPVIAQAARAASGRYGRRTSGFSQIRSREILVIPNADIEAENLAAITEDLQVMSRIFDEKFKEPLRGEIQGVFVDFGDIFGRDSRQTEAIYMQGYGVLFLMEVNFAFSPEPKAQEKQAEETEDVDPIWQRTRQKIFAPPGFGGDEPVPEQKYSAVKIDQLKTELIKTLKHAANIRNIQPDEWVILTVIGKARQPGGMYEYGFSRSRTPRTQSSSSRGRSSSGSEGGMYGGGMYGGDMGGFGGGGYGVSSRMSGGMAGMSGMGGSMGSGGFSGGMMMGGGMMGGMGMGAMYGEEYSETGSTPATVLTIRAKKSDVDDFAKQGDIYFGGFREKVEIFIY